MAVSQFLVAMLGTLTTGQDVAGNIIVYNVAAQKAGIAFICLYIFFFASTWGPLAWVVTGEIFPLKHRAKGLSMTTATNVSDYIFLIPVPLSEMQRQLTMCQQWLLNWAIAYATPYLVNYGEGYANLQSKIFFIWFACCFLCISFVYFFIYETKGWSLEEVDELYSEVSSARKSAAWTPSTTFAQRRAAHSNGDGAVHEGGLIEKPDGKSEQHSDGVSHHDEHPVV